MSCHKPNSKAQTHDLLDSTDILKDRAFIYENEKCIQQNGHTKRILKAL
jgi:hypothetical protein